MRTCQANGTWSGFRTICSGMLKANIGENVLNLQALHLNTSSTRATAFFVGMYAHANVTTDRISFSPLNSYFWLNAVLLMFLSRNCFCNMSASAYRTHMAYAIP